MTKQKNSIIPIEIIVIGTGNIAIRHIKNIQLLKPMNKIFVLKRSNRTLDKFFKKSNINIINNIEDFTQQIQNHLRLSVHQPLYI